MANDGEPTEAEDRSFEAFLENYPAIMTMREFDAAWIAFEINEGREP